MNILLDTHILIRALTADDKLSGKAKDFIVNPDNIIFYSAASIWEISIKHALHPDKIPFSGKELSSYCTQAGYEPLDISDRHVFALESLKRAESAKPHNDPFDRIMISQAKAENMLFLTHDTLLPDYNEACIIPV